MNILKKPVVSEKATSLNELANCASFIVDSRANKIQIKKAVENSYNVTVLKVRPMIYGLIEKLSIPKQVSKKVKVYL